MLALHTKKQQEKNQQAQCRDFPRNRDEHVHRGSELRHERNTTRKRSKEDTSFRVTTKYNKNIHTDSNHKLNECRINAYNYKHLAERCITRAKTKNGDTVDGNVGQVYKPRMEIDSKSFQAA
jgi:hypothetical protein